MKNYCLTDLFIRGIKKWGLIMRLTLFFIVGFLFMANANIYSQNARLDIKLKNGTITELIEQIEENSEFVFLYKNEDLDLKKKITINLKNATIKQVMDLALEDQNLDYDVYERQIILRKSEADITGVTEVQQDRTVTGVVTDQGGLPLPGVSVIVKGTTIGTVTDPDGKFSLSIPSTAEILQFSFVGMRTQEVDIKGRTTFTVVMEEDIIGLEEVVAIGYGTQRKENLTGSVDVVTPEVIANRSAPNMSFLLQGTAPNMQFTMDPQGGGEPGASGTWNIRGIGSITGNDRPLVLVDGVEQNMNDINPEDVESISILKDASASAVYGARAPFGVVLIMTKSGRKGRPVIKFTSNVALKQFLNVHDQVDALTWTTAYNQAAANAGAPPLYSEAQIERIRGYIDGTFPYEYDPDDPITSIWGGRRYGNANYSWPQELFRDFNMQHKHDISMSGGDQNTQYYVSLGYFDEDGIYRYGYDDYQRYNLLSNVNSDITDWLSFSLKVRYAMTKQDYPEGQTSAERIRMLQEPSTFAPIMPKYNINGTIQCPLIRWQQDAGRDVTERNDLWMTVGSTLEPLKGWVTDFTYSFNKYSRSLEEHPQPVWVELGDGSFGNIGRALSAFNKTMNMDKYSLINVVTSYENTLGKNYFKIMTGYEQEYQFYSSLYGRGEDLITDKVPAISTALGALSVDDSKSHWATQGIFGRFNYNYDERYLLELSARYNGSSRFQPGSRWGFFPSGSVGYRISEENFWTSLEHYVNNLKFRASYGSLGNQNVSNYLYLSRIPVTANHEYIINNELPIRASTPGLISDDLTWETITTLNLGLDAGFLNNRLELVFDWYSRITTDMIGPSTPLPTLLGASVPRQNNAELETKGFELVLRWRDRISEDFSYNAQISLGDNKTTILEYQNPEGLIDSWYVGKEVGEIWGYTTDRIMQTEEDLNNMPDQSDLYSRWGLGDIMYKDLDNDGEITYGERTLKNHGDLRVIGNTSPRYNISVNGGFNWKKFDFNMFWQGIGRRQYYPRTNDSFVFWGLIGGFGHSSVLKDTKHLDYWRSANETNEFGPNTDSYFPKPYFSNETYKNRQIQTKYLQDASYLRLKSLQIGYTLPQRIVRNLFIQNLRVFFTGENLLTLKNLPKLMDPETSVLSEQQFGGYRAGIIYPISRNYAIGLNLTF